MEKILRFGLILGVLAGLGYGGYVFYGYYQNRFDGGENIMLIDENESADIYIKTGSSTQEVADVLVSENIISDRDKFIKAADKLNYAGNNVVPGYYKVTGDLTVGKLVQHLRTGRGRLEVTFSTDNVWTLQQLAGKVAPKLELDSAELVDYIFADSVMDKYGLNEHTMVTLFYANTFSNNWALSPQELVEFMASKYRAFWTAERKARAAEMNLSQSEIYTLASIVYGECGNLSSEWPIVAGLYVNRLKKGMKLQADPTAKFASGDFDAQRVYHKHTKLEHPFNTYHIQGLPPGPIKTVPEGCLDAILNYSEHNYIFMCAKPNNERGHAFASSNAEHERNANAYRRWLNQNNIR